MWTTILSCALLTAAPASQAGDTTFAVDPRARLRMEDVRGDVTIHTWDQPRMRVQVRDADDARLRVSAGATTVSISLEAEIPRGRGAGGDFELTIPASMSISLSGQSGDVRIEGTTGEVSVQTVQGDIVVRGGTGVVQLRSVNGDITLGGARARADVHVVSGDIRLSDVAGDIVAESMNGDVHLARIDAGGVQASTVSGDLHYDGAIRPEGRYALTTHNGDISFALPPTASAVLRATTFSGDLQSDIPLQLTEQTRGKTSLFTLGAGSARIELQSFSGDIHLTRPGSDAADH